MYLKSAETKSIIFGLGFLLPAILFFLGLGACVVNYENDILGIFHNTSAVDELSFDLSKLDVDFTKIIDQIGVGKAKLKGSILTIGPQTSVIVE